MDFEAFLGQVLSSPITLFLASVLFTLASFNWVKKLLNNFKACFWHALAAGMFNGAAAVITELVVNRPIPSAMMAFVPIVTVIELRLFSHDRPWPYMFILSAFLLNFGAIHDLSVAALGLSPAIDNWAPASVEYRMVIFTVALFFCSLLLFLLARFMMAKELFALLHSKEKSLMLFLYMMTSGVVLIIASGVTVPVLFNSQLPAGVSTPVYVDLVLKDLLLLACSYMITLIQCSAERASQRSSALSSELCQEKKFRSTIQQQAVLSYVFNVTQNRVIEGLEYFKTHLRGDPPDDYRHILNELVKACVHPSDRETIFKNGAYLITKEQHDAGRNVQALRFRVSSANFKEALELPDAAKELIPDKEWVWLEARAAIVNDNASGDVIAYIDITDVDEKVTHEENLQNAARLDAVTGIYNRATLEHKIKRYLSKKDALGAMFMIDIDNFKVVNDSYGHQAGDALLKEVAGSIRSVFRPSDIIGRIGGDEFCVFAVGLCSKEVIASRARNLIGSVQNIQIPGIADGFIKSLSIGIASCPDYGRDYETLYDHSDIALYHAKDSGKNDFCFYMGEKRGDLAGRLAGAAKPLES